MKRPWINVWTSSMLKVRGYCRKSNLPAGALEEQFRTAASLLATIRKRLDGVISPEIKRRIVELWVEKAQADTVERWGALENDVENLTLKLNSQENCETRLRLANERDLEMLPSCGPAWTVFECLSLG